MSANPKRGKFLNAHLWLLLPFAITIAGFYIPYWSRFSEVPFRQHVHGLSATVWFALLIIQPWLFNNKPIFYHRRVGYIGLFLAGGVLFSALTLLPHNLTSEKLSHVTKYGITFHNICALVGFGTSVILAMLNSRDLSKHARWMISTAIWILQPAVTRLIYIPLVRANEGQSPIEYIYIWNACLAVSVVPLLVMMYLDYRSERKIYTPYLFTLIGVTIAVSLFKVMGTTQWWIDLCNAVLLKGLN